MEWVCLSCFIFPVLVSRAIFLMASISSSFIMRSQGCCTLLLVIKEQYSFQWCYLIFRIYDGLLFFWGRLLAGWGRVVLNVFLSVFFLERFLLKVVNDRIWLIFWGWLRGWERYWVILLRWKECYWGVLIWWVNCCDTIVLQVGFLSYWIWVMEIDWEVSILFCLFSFLKNSIRLILNLKYW